MCGVYENYTMAVIRWLDTMCIVLGGRDSHRLYGRYFKIAIRGLRGMVMPTLFRVDVTTSDKNPFIAKSHTTESINTTHRPVTNHRNWQ